MHWGNLQFGSVAMNVFIAPLALYGLVLGVSSYFWSSVEGTVIKSETIQISRSSGWDNASQVKFSYVVNGEVYTSYRVKINARITTGRSHYDPKYKYLYKVGEPVIVYYPSLYPSFGVLIRGMTAHTVFALILCLIFVYTFKLSSKKLKEQT